MSATPTAPNCVNVLMDYTQADEDGVFVNVSRQAIHETVEALAAATSRATEAERLLRFYQVYGGSRTFAKSVHNFFAATGAKT